MTEHVIVPTVSKIDKQTIVVTWAAMADTDSGAAIDVAGYPDKTVHVYGTFGGATTTLYGSNDPKADVDRKAGTLFGSKTASWVALTDNLGNNLAPNAAALKVVLENPQYVLPVNTGGSGSAINVVLVCSRNKI